MRLDQLVASAFQGEIEIDVQRVTPVNSSGKSQFRGIVNYANGSGVVHQGVLDLLVNGSEADISFDTMYVDTIPIPPELGRDDSFPVTYVSHHETESENAMPIRIVSIGATTVESSEEKRKTPKKKEPSKIKEVINPIPYALEERGLITIVKDVAELDRVKLWEKTQMKAQGYAGQVLRRETERHGFVDYTTHTRTGSLKRVTLVPRGSEERIYEGLTLDTFTDLELIKKEDVEKYVGQYVAERNLQVEAKIGSSPIITFKDGKKYVQKESIDAILKEAGIEISKEAERTDKPKREKKDTSVDALVNVYEYQPLGRTRNNVYCYEGRSAPLFDEAEKFVKYGEIFNPFTPEHLTGGARSAYQNAMRTRILKTTAAKDRRDEEGKLVPETEVGRGKKHYLETAIANQCIKYLVDQGHTMPAKVE